jgi:hypothetical protein
LPRSTCDCFNQCRTAVSVRSSSRHLARGLPARQHLPHHLGLELVSEATPQALRLAWPHVGHRIRPSFGVHETGSSPKRRAHELRGRDRLRAACPSADAFVEALAVRGEHLGGQVSRLLKLLDRYDKAELEIALKDALSRGAIGAASVAHVLDQRARAQKRAPALDLILPDDPRVRDLHVTPHGLDTYDSLAKPKD